MGRKLATAERAMRRDSLFLPDTDVRLLGDKIVSNCASIREALADLGSSLEELKVEVAKEHIPNADKLGRECRIARHVFKTLEMDVNVGSERTRGK